MNPEQAYLHAMLLIKGARLDLSSMRACLN
jgi:hypothetical protein